MGEISNKVALNIAEIDDHLFYEMRMLVYSLGKLIQIIKVPKQNQTKDQIKESYVFFETFLLHARNLNHFFTREPNKNNTDDVLVKRFGFDEPIPSYTEINEDTITKIHKFLAHLTWSRTKLTKLSFYECLPITVKIYENLNKFINYMRLSGSVSDNILDSYTTVLERLDNFIRLMEKGFRGSKGKNIKDDKYHSGATASDVFK